MTTEIYIISGFLGAGKTTLIQKLLKDAFCNEKVVLIENDFGDISIDAALLNSGSIEVKEINSGCICCSLSGDFIKALKDLLDRFRPDKVIVEPSGVGKLSDIVKACSDPRIRPFARIEKKITVVDVKRCKMYLDNFGEFFEDQIENADVVLLSRVSDFPEKVDTAYKIINDLNRTAVIISKPWKQLRAEEILFAGNPLHERTEDCLAGDCGYGCMDNHEHEHGCGHNHSAEEAFDTVTIRTNRMFSVEDLTARLSFMERNAKGTVLRAKGIVRGSSGYVNLQYVPGDIQITKCEVGGNILCIIGRNLNRQELLCLFSGE